MNYLRNNPTPTIGLLLSFIGMHCCVVWFANKDHPIIGDIVVCALPVLLILLIVSIVLLRGYVLLRCVIGSCILLYLALILGLIWMVWFVWMD